MGGRQFVAWFLICEVALFALASLAHGGRLVSGYEHLRAAIAEAVIAGVLAAGLVAFLALPRLARRIALAVQIFALVGVLAGLVAVAMGMASQSMPDLILHGVLILVLLLGFLFTLRSH
jgi:hypothetical protein